MVVNFLNKEMNQETRNKFYNMCEQCVNYNDIIINVKYCGCTTYSIEINLIALDEIQSEFFSVVECELLACDNYYICKCMVFIYKLLKAKQKIIEIHNITK